MYVCICMYRVSHLKPATRITATILMIGKKCLKEKLFVIMGHKIVGVIRVAGLK